MKKLILAFLLLLVSTTAKAEKWSVFAPISKTPPPRVDAPEWSRPLDAFIFAQLKDAGLAPAPAVDRRTWMRRVSFDLLGLPPSPGEVQRLIADPRPDAEAMAEVVKRLLASPRYGERWGRHWLDVVRYADSDGFAIDEERVSLWRFRDYVIRTLNEDRPFDQFIREQIAGDELDAGPGGRIALSFFRLGPYEADNMTKENRRQDYLNEITSAVGSSFLGLSVGCARCHDHKFDPIPQKDFYQLQAFFSPLKRASISADYLDGEMTDALRRRYDQAVGSRLGKINKLKADIRKRIAEAMKVPVAEISDEQLNKAIKEKKAPVTEKDANKLNELMTSAAHLRPEQRFEPKAVAVLNPAGDDKLTETFILNNGDVFDPGAKVRPGFLSSAPVWSKSLLKRAADSAGSPGGRRLVLAEWLTSPHNPITPRVLVNRLWNYHFGAGLVVTPNDFGANGSGPSHPALLDYLARRLADEGWRLKPLHREIVLSRAYRTSLRHADAKNCARIDPENRLLWRGTLRRLESETIRDTLLAVSGRLRFETGGPGFYEMLPEGMKDKYSFFEWHPSSELQRRRRSVYMFQRRNLVHPMMESFDVADASESCERRRNSVTAPQALTLFNGRLAHENSEHLAKRLQSQSADDARRIEQLFWLAFARAPASDELELCVKFLTEKRSAHAADSKDATPDRHELAALTDLCLAILNTNEFIYLD